jgi:hypothetical protein
MHYSIVQHGIKSLGLMTRSQLCVLCGQRNCHSADKLERQFLIVRERQISLWPAKPRSLQNERFIVNNGWIDTYVMLERGEVEEAPALFERWHVVADAPHRAGHSALDFRPHLLQPYT